MNQAKYIGMDVHQATISVAVMDSAGRLILESILETKAATVGQARLSAFGYKRLQSLKSRR
jgi:hypothetical protein